jgi:predicted transcriptional regulator
MGDFPDFERGHLLCALPGSSATRSATLLRVSTATVSKVMSAYTNHEKTTPATRKIGRKLTLTERDRRTLRRTVSKNHITTAAELNIHLEEPVSTKTVRRDLHKSNINPQ